MTDSGKLISTWSPLRAVQNPMKPCLLVPVTVIFIPRDSITLPILIWFTLLIDLFVVMVRDSNIRLQRVKR